MPSASEASTSSVAAGMALVRLLEDLERAGTTVMDLIRGGRAQETWRLYPGEAGVFDRRTRSQFYYHAHDARPEEAGHFHTVRLFADHTVHLVAISMAPDGWPRALFTVNRWVTGDTWEPAATLKRYVRAFHVEERRGPVEVVRFVNLVFRAFGPEIDGLQDDKTVLLSARQARHPERNVLEDRGLEVISQVPIDPRAVAAGRFGADVPAIDAQVRDRIRSRAGGGAGG